MSEKDQDAPVGKLICGGGARIECSKEIPKERSSFVLKNVRVVQDGQGVAYLAKLRPVKSR